eukprot:15366609-Ditylum_brightwellii.AAC.1
MKELLDILLQVVDQCRRSVMKNIQKDSAHKERDVHKDIIMKATLHQCIETIQFLCIAPTKGYMRQILLESNDVLDSLIRIVALPSHSSIVYGNEPAISTLKQYVMENDVRQCAHRVIQNLTSLLEQDIERVSNNEARSRAIIFCGIADFMLCLNKKLGASQCGMSLLSFEKESMPTWSKYIISLLISCSTDLHRNNMINEHYITQMAPLENMLTQLMSSILAEGCVQASFYDTKQRRARSIEIEYGNCAMMTLFFLCHSHEIAPSIVRQPSLIQSLLHLATQHGSAYYALSLKAAECIHLVTTGFVEKKRHTRQEVSQACNNVLMKSLADILCMSKHFQAKCSALQGLNVLIEDDVSCFEKLIHSSEISCNNLLDAMILLHQKKCEHISEEDKKEVLIASVGLAMKIVTVARRGEMQVAYSYALQALLSFLENSKVRNDEKILKKITMETESLGSSVVQANVGGMIKTLSQVAGDVLCPLPSRIHATRAILNLSRDPANLESMAKNPAVIDGLMQAAAVRDGNEEQVNLLRGMAVKAITNLASQVTNRRILAKKMGLMPFLIRLARSIQSPRESSSSSEHHLKVLKDDLRGIISMLVMAM